MEFIDVRLRWDGKVNRSDLTDFFGTSVPQASADLTEYARRAPSSMTYDSSAKAYVASAEFAPLYPPDNPDRYLNDLYAVETGITRPDASFLGWRPEIGAVSAPERQADAGVFFAIVSAMRDRKSLSITYQSMTDPAPKVRAISPHALGFDGFRWHARAYCHLRRDYRDFVLGRILDATESAEPAPAGTEDGGWHLILTLVLIPNPALSAAQKAVIAHDYCMQSGRVEYRCRRSMLFYALRRFGLDASSSADARGHHLFLANREELSEYLKSASYRRPPQE